MKFFLSLAAATCALAACASQDAPTATRIPNTRSNVVSVGGGPLFTGACTRSTGKPQEVVFTFNGSAGGSATLEVTDNGVQGLNGTITLNGATIVTHPMLGGNGPVHISLPITTASQNTLVCELEGKPGSGLSMTATQ